jgi:PKD repeat protein
VVEWSLDEISGLTAADVVGSNDVALSGSTTFMPAVDGDGFLAFDGVSGYGAIADDALVGPLPSRDGAALEDFSLTGWIRLDSADRRNPILSKQGTSDAGDSRGFLFTTGEGQTAGQLSFEGYRDQSTKTAVVAGTALTSGPGAQWHHVAATYDFVTDGTSQVRLYVDGEEVAADLAAVGPLQGNPQPMEMGRYFWSGSYSRYFDGDMDDVRIFDRALSGVDVADLLVTRPVAPTAVLSASTQTGEAPQLVSFDAGASVDDGTIVSYDWDFGDGTTDSGVVVDHTFASNGDYVVTLTVTDDESRTGIATTPIALGPQELVAFEVNRLVTKADRGFPWNQPPMASANGDWTSPVNYADGRLYIRAEIKDGGQPVPKSMRLQFCVWQDQLTKETCGSLNTIVGNPGNVVEWSQSISSMWKKNGVPIDWSRARQRYGIAIKNMSAQPVSDFAGWNWFGEDPDEWYPLDLRFTVVAVPQGEAFGGWGAYIDDQG